VEEAELPDSRPHSVGQVVRLGTAFALPQVEQTHGGFRLGLLLQVFNY